MVLFVHVSQGAGKLQDVKIKSVHSTVGTTPSEIQTKDIQFSSLMEKIGLFW